jgi:hypothetical protein
MKYRISMDDPRLPLLVRSIAEIELLLANPRAIRRLPRAGIRVAHEECDPRVSETIQTGLLAYINACGCAEGGATAGITLLAVVAFMARQVTTRGPHWSDLGLAAAGLVLVLTVGGLGKLLGVALARVRFARCCRRALQIPRNPSHSQEHEP